jgi:hypothetical protein
LHSPYSVEQPEAERQDFFVAFHWSFGRRSDIGFRSSSALSWFAQSRDNQISTTRQVTGKENNAFDFKRLPTFFAFSPSAF